MDQGHAGSRDQYRRTIQNIARTAATSMAKRNSSTGSLNTTHIGGHSARAEQETSKRCQGDQRDYRFSITPMLWPSFSNSMPASCRAFMSASYVLMRTSALPVSMRATTVTDIEDLRASSVCDHPRSARAARICAGQVL